jgi:hypothetical protein
MGAIDRRKRVAHDRWRGYAERGYCPRCLPFQFFDHTPILAAQAGCILLPVLIAFGRIHIGLRCVKYMKYVNSYLH